MARLLEVDLAEGITVLVETKDDVSIPRSVAANFAYQRGVRSVDQKADFHRVESLLKHFTQRSVSAIKDASADVDRVKLEFGVSLGGDAGLPFINDDAGKGSLKVTVECDLRRDDKHLSFE